MATTKKKNPYQAGWGLQPPCFAGRQDEFEEIEDALRAIEGEKGQMDHAPDTAIVLLGPHGVGKTALLGRAIEEARKLGIHTARITSDDLSGPQENIVRHLFKGQELKEHKDSYWLAFSRLLERKPLFLVLEDAHDCDIDALDKLFDVVQDCMSSSLPLAPVISGTPVLEYVSRRGRAGYMERSNFLRIGNLSHGEAAEALEIPAAESGLPMEPAALKFLLDWSGNYPYFIQIAGNRAWEVSSERGGSTITEADAKSGLVKADKDRDALYKEMFQKFGERNLEEHARQAAETIRAQEGGKFDVFDLADRLKEMNEGDDGFNEHRAVEDLMEVGFLWDPDEIVVPGVPSIFDYAMGKAK